LLIEQAQNTTDKNWLDSPNGQEFLNIVRPNLKWLKLQGGEALTVKSIRYLIESLDHEQTVLFITTNGTVLDKKLLQAFSKIKKVQVAISIEAAGPANDVIRYGSNWETVSNNIRTLLELPNVELQLNHVLQATSALFLPSVVEFAENVNTHVAILPLNQHKYLALEAVPTPVLQKMIDTIQRMDIKHSKNQYIKNFVSTVTSTVEFNKTIHTQFKDYISTLDSVRDHKLYPFCKEIINYEILTVNLL
jgi:sulfatase maturation enzyme AslB (radical SAM superfamily)